MNYRLRTSKKVEEKLKEIQASTNMTPNIIVRIAVGLALSLNEPPDPKEVSDTSGIEFNRVTLTGDQDIVYKTLITQHQERYITDEEYFPVIFNSYLERGMGEIEKRYDTRNPDKFIISLLSL